ncbi:hypothetical protein HPB50_013133 [Hyalomma asiaticum]|uniref:Uncharacterized protein n=1 Tax=Hyalomma asiaticum TaxID=266040 RepID=A0ACB7RRZ5_HYAAI|nr:hypothetical protein HPB50_013133 [Hyalomma asiaticum]
MDSSLEMPAKIFIYVKSMFRDIVDQDMTVSFHGPMPLLLAATPSVAEKVLSGTENINKSFLYTMMKSWIGNGLLTSLPVLTPKKTPDLAVLRWL